MNEQHSMNIILKQNSIIKLQFEAAVSEKFEFKARGI